MALTLANNRFEKSEAKRMEYYNAISKARQLVNFVDQ